MKKSRIIWGLWLILAVIFCGITDTITGYLLLAVSVVVPLLSGITLFVIQGKIDVQLTLAAYGEKEKPITGKLIIKNRSFFPADRLRFRVYCENLLTGEKEYTSIYMAAPARAVVDTEFQFQSRHAGKVRISLKSMVWYDLFGLFSSRLTFQGEATAVGMIAPDIFPVEVQIAYGESSNMDSDEYSMKKAGYDPSETFAIREYRPGDRIRQIHWKLTQKFDQLMTREASLPVDQSVLILFDTRKPKGGQIPAEQLDAAAEVVATLSQSLLENGLAHRIVWRDASTGGLSSASVSSTEELTEALGGVLTCRNADNLSTLDVYRMEKGTPEVSHLFAVCACVPCEIDDSFEVASTVLCGCKDVQSAPQNGVLYFGFETYADDLAALVL